MSEVQNTQIKYFHLRTTNDFGGTENHGGLTIAWKVTELGSLEYGVSQCSYLDNFNKATGREIALKRLNTNTQVISNEVIMSKIANMEVNGISKSKAIEIKRTLTVNDLSLNFIRELILHDIFSM